MSVIDVGADFAREVAVFGGLDANDDALGIDGIHDSVALADSNGAGIARRDLFHAGSDKRSCGAQQRNRLALHVRSHQCAVGVVVLEERNQRCGDRNQLLRRNVDVVDFVAMLQDEVAGLTHVDQFVDRCVPFLSSSTLAWATRYLSSSQADR